MHSAYKCLWKKKKDPLETQSKNEFSSWQSEKSHIPRRLCARRREESRGYLINKRNTAYVPDIVYIKKRASTCSIDVNQNTIHN